MTTTVFRSDNVDHLNYSCYPPTVTGIKKNCRGTIASSYPKTRPIFSGLVPCPLLRGRRANELKKNGVERSRWNEAAKTFDALCRSAAGSGGLKADCQKTELYFLCGPHDGNLPKAAPRSSSHPDLGV